MARYLRIDRPPASGSPTLDAWLGRLTDAINALPAILLSDRTLPNTSGVTGARGTLLINISSSGSLLWINESSTTNSWTTIA